MNVLKTRTSIVLNPSETMKELIEKIAKLTNVVYSREKFWKMGSMVLFPGAPAPEIVALSKQLMAPLPPSYREFLTITNGCLGFWARYTLLGTADDTRDPIKTAIDDAQGFLTQYAAGPDGTVTPESIREYEKEVDGKQRLYVPCHLVFGANQAGEFFIFDERTNPPDGEYEVMHYTYSAGVYKRFENFPAFLSARLEMLEKRVLEKKYPVP